MTDQPKELASVITFKAPYRFTPELLARLLMADKDQLKRLVVYAEYESGKKHLLHSSGTTIGFMAEAGACMVAKAGNSSTPKEKK